MKDNLFVCLVSCTGNMMRVRSCLPKLNYQPLKNGQCVLFALKVFNSDSVVDG